MEGPRKRYDMGAATMAEVAMNMVAPGIEALLREAGKTSDSPKRPHLHLIILRPGTVYTEDININGAVLYWRNFSLDGKDFEYPYDEVARAKAKASLRTGFATGYLSRCAPHLFKRGDMKYQGSWVTPSGTITAASGVQGYYDEMFARWYAAAFEAVALHRVLPILEDQTRDLVFEDHEPG